MKRTFIFATEKGSIHTPMGYERNAYQVIGKADGPAPTEAYATLVSRKPELVKQGYPEALDSNIFWEEVENHDYMDSKATIMATTVGLLYALQRNEHLDVGIQLKRLSEAYACISGYFPVTYVNRNDIEHNGYDSNLSDDVMVRIAERMSNGITESNFWDCVDEACEYMEVEDLFGPIEKAYYDFKTRTGNAPNIMVMDYKDCKTGEVYQGGVFGLAWSSDYDDAAEKVEDVLFQFTCLEEVKGRLYNPFMANALLVNPRSVLFEYREVK